MTKDELKRARIAYHSQKKGAKERGIEWLFTFDTWLEGWIASGYWELRGRNKGKYQMCRKDDEGPYSPDNVYYDTTENNGLFAHEKQKRSQQWVEYVDQLKKHGRPGGYTSKKVIIHGIEYASAVEAAKALGLHWATVYRRIKQECPGYHFL